MTNFDVVLFDLDGTLIDTNHLIVTSFQHTFRTHLGREVAPEEIYPCFGEPLSRTMARHAPEQVDQLCEVYRAFNAAEHDRLIRQFAGVREAVAELQNAGVALAVVTSKRGGTALRGLQVCGMDQFFPVVVGIEATEKHKPDPEPCLAALRRLGLDPGPRGLMVGDSPFDVFCGRNAGLKTAAVGWTVNRPPLEASHPDYWVESPAELTRLVLDAG